MTACREHQQRSLRLIETAVYRGPHLYSGRPMIRLQLDLGVLEAWPSNLIPGFNQRLLSLLPGLENHGCSYGSPGGLRRRMEDGTWLGHVAEHVALELQSLAGHPTTRGKTRSVKGQAGVYNILFEYREETVGLAAGHAALRLVESLLPDGLRGLAGVPQTEGPFDLAATLDALTQQLRALSLGPTTASLVEAARRLRIPVKRLNDQSLIRLGWGRNQKLIRASVTSGTSLIAAETAGDKHLTRRLLQAAGLPVPRGVVVRDVDLAVAEANRLRRPLVTKPLDGNHGRGVSLGLETPADIADGFRRAREHGPRVIVEEQLRGRDYRILVVDRKVVAVAERAPARVTGDGVSTIAELVSRVNADPRRGKGHEAVLTRIRLDEAMIGRLSKLGLTTQSVPTSRQVIQLCDTANLSTGGEAIDRTDQIHPVNAFIARRAATAVGLDIAGIDFIAPDIAQPVTESGGGIVEVNAAPGFRMHLAPSEGHARDVAAPVLKMLFPDRSKARIPVVAVTGTNGKSTTVRMVARILARHGLSVGFTSTSGVYIEGERVWKGDASGPISARMLLADAAVEVAVLETARGGILREGLGFDRCDVGCVLNVSEDHLGVNGIQTIEELAAVKSVVTESVARGGVSVLNGDDPLTIRMARHARGALAYFSLAGGPALSAHLQKHIALGGMAAALAPSMRGGDLVLYEAGRSQSVMSVDSLPSALRGAARFNIANGLAATLIARGLGVPVDTIAAALADFHSSFEDNPGRMNIHAAHGVRIVVDYAHNPAGVIALGDAVHALRGDEGRIIGCISIPGDRRDADIREMGVLAARLFDKIIFREKPDGRGRAPGEVLRLMRDGALSDGCTEDRLHCIADEAAAMAAALAMARPGDLVVLLPTDVEAVWRQVLAYRPAAKASGAHPSPLSA